MESLDCELEDFGQRGVSTFLQKLGKPRFLPEVSSAMVCGVLDDAVSLYSKLLGHDYVVYYLFAKAIWPWLVFTYNYFGQGVDYFAEKLVNTIGRNSI